MDESGTECKPTDCSPQLIVKEMNHELGTEIHDNSGCDHSERMRDEASGSKASRYSRLLANPLKNSRWMIPPAGNGLKISLDGM
jgi:hypothetical protein